MMSDPVLDLLDEWGRTDAYIRQRAAMCRAKDAEEMDRIARPSYLSAARYSWGETPRSHYYSLYPKLPPGTAIPVSDPPPDLITAQWLRALQDYHDARGDTRRLRPF